MKVYLTTVKIIEAEIKQDASGDYIQIKVEADPMQYRSEADIKAAYKLIRQPKKRLPNPQKLEAIREIMGSQYPIRKIGEEAVYEKEFTAVMEYNSEEHERFIEAAKNQSPEDVSLLVMEPGDRNPELGRGAKYTKKCYSI